MNYTQKFSCASLFCVNPTTSADSLLYNAMPKVSSCTPSDILYMDPKNIVALNYPLVSDQDVIIFYGQFVELKYPHDNHKIKKNGKINYNLFSSFHSDKSNNFSKKIPIFSYH